ncbi:MAG: hypothetical protein VXZ96_10895 [Myxococcota bacterium]|nr:hypothetical protein [Myxococcota bacterium]
MIWLFCVLGLALAEDSDDPMKSLDAFEIKGTVQEPALQMIITRENLDKEYSLELTESFIPKIIESMKTSPL